MALTAPVITSALIADGPPTHQGLSFPQVATGIGTAISLWVSQGNVALVGAAVGTLGAGAVAGTVILAPSVDIVLAAFTGVGLVGPTAPGLARVLATGLATAVTASGTYVGASPTVGVGTDVSAVAPGSATAATLLPLLNANLPGLSGPLVSTGIAAGVSALFLTIITKPGTGVVAGPPSPVPSSGVTTSVLV